MLSVLYSRVMFNLVSPKLLIEFIPSICHHYSLCMLFILMLVFARCVSTDFEELFAVD